MKVLSYEGLQLYHQLASDQFNKADEIGSINERIDDIDLEIDDIDTEIGTLKSNVKQSNWIQADEGAIDFILNKPTILTSADVSAQIQAEVGDVIGVSAITNAEIDEICK